MVVGRFLGVALVVISLLCGLVLLHGSARGEFAMGLLRIWGAIGGFGIVGVALASFCSSVSGSERVVRGIGGAYLGLGVLTGVLLVMNASGSIVLRNNMQPWVLLLVCIFGGGTLLFGSRA